MTDVSDYKTRQREAERESLLSTVALAAVPVLLVAAALLAHFAMIQLFGA